MVVMGSSANEHDLRAVSARLKDQIRSHLDVVGVGLVRGGDFIRVLKAAGIADPDIIDLTGSFQDPDGNIHYCDFLDFVFFGEGSDHNPPDGLVVKPGAPRGLSGTAVAKNASAELAWLRNLTTVLPEQLKSALVAYRGFHCENDLGMIRPLENTLQAFEQAWSAGIRTCECDVFVTNDGKLCLNHDASLERLALASKQLEPSKRTSLVSKNVAGLSFRELLETPLKTGVCPALLEEVLGVAAHFDDAKLIIDLKPANSKALAAAVASFCVQHPEFVNKIAAVTSFDPNVLVDFIQLCKDQPRPLVLQIVVQDATSAHTGLRAELLDTNRADVCEAAESLLSKGGCRLDGVYCQWTNSLLGEAAGKLHRLCKRFPVGVWAYENDLDNLGSAAHLARLGVRFIDTTFPKGFLREVVVDDSVRLPLGSPRGPEGGKFLFGRSRREELLERLQAHGEFDMLVIGGGATGLGTALEAARLGYRVALVERGDFACGTSSKSTNMIHGGVRYLQAFVRDPQGAKEQMGVVRRGLAEENYMYNSAPFLVKPVPFMVACYSEEERCQYEQLLKAYDDLGKDDPFPEAQWCGKKETLFRFPQLRQEGLVGSWVYYDGQQDDARMALFIAETALEAGAVVANYVNVESLIKDNNGIVRGARCTDAEFGLPPSAAFEVRAKVVVNATGPFTDAILKMDQGPGAKPLVKPSAGTHIVIPDHFSPDRTALAILETSDGRAIFYLPWMGQTMVGTTDYISEVKAQLVAPEEDIDWILSEVNRYLNPGSEHARKADVLAAWCGIRPLAYGTESATGTKETSAGKATKSVSREHVVLVSESKLVTISGGKWTSYRAMAEHTVSEAVLVGGLAPPKFVRKPADCHDGPIPEMELGLIGCKAGANAPYKRLELACAAPFHAEMVTLREAYGLERDIAELLIASYGMFACNVARIARSGRGLTERIARGYSWILAQVAYACQEEHALSLPDVLSRRTRLAQVDVLAAYDAVPRVADVMASELGWDSQRVEAEVCQANEFLKSCGLEHCRKHRLRL